LGLSREGSGWGLAKGRLTGFGLNERDSRTGSAASRKERRRRSLFCGVTPNFPFFDIGNTYCDLL